MTALPDLPAPDAAALYAMLEYKRPHGSRSEAKFINRFLRPLKMQQDDYGNLFKVVGDAPRVMWCAHTDSVHGRQGKQAIVADVEAQCLRLAPKHRDDVLGADNAAGVWLLVEMIKAGVPGLYCFFRNEERGRLGSEHFAKHSADMLKGVDFAIAFDRRGLRSVITHQFCGRTCSDAFAKQLADLLGMGMVPDNGGIYTDTASFVDQIAECTNVSVGYFDEHTSKESLYWPHVFALRDALLSMDVSAFEAHRQPGSDDDYWQDYFNNGYSARRYNKWADQWDDTTDEDDVLAYTSNCGGFSGGGQLERLVRDNPGVVAAILEEHGYSADSLDEAITAILGFAPHGRH